jgi:hypothetical protein
MRCAALAIAVVGLTVQANIAAAEHQVKTGRPPAGASGSSTSSASTVSTVEAWVWIAALALSLLVAAFLIGFRRRRSGSPAY